MISKKYYQELLSDNPHKRDRTKTEEDLFNYIVESEINGNYTQVKEFVFKLSQDQHANFLSYLSNNNIEVKRCFLK